MRSEAQLVQQIINCLDLTLLDEQATIEALHSLEQQALIHKVAALCVFPQHLQELHKARNTLKLATVINFPHGQHSTEDCLKEFQAACELGANEIDYVIPYQAYLKGSKQQALQHCETIAKACQKQQLPLKVIMETGAFTDMKTVYELSRELIHLGCNFLKTSTGKIPQGASVPAATAMLTAIKDSSANCGLKVSGGVKTPEQALTYAHLAESILAKEIDPSWFRIGASSLLTELSRHSK